MLEVVDAVGRTLWSNTFIGNWPMNGVISSDAFGNIYFAGELAGTLVFNGGLVTGPDSRSMTFLVKFDPSGAPLFSAVIDTTEVFAMSVANDVWLETPDHLMRVSAVDGHALGTIPFASQSMVVDRCTNRTTLAGPSSVVQLDREGNPLWTHTWLAPTAFDQTVIAADGVGNIIAIASHPYETSNNVPVPEIAALSSYDVLGRQRFSIPWPIASAISSEVTFINLAASTGGSIVAIGRLGQQLHVDPQPAIDFGLGPLSPPTNTGPWNGAFLVRFE